MGPLILEKAETAALADTGADGSAPIRVGFGWTNRKRRLRPWQLVGFSPVYDTTARCLLLDRDGGLVDQVGFRWKGAQFGSESSADGSVEHSWNDLDGHNEEWDDNSILVRLAELPEQVEALVFIVVSASGGSHTRLLDVTCRVWDERSREVNRDLPDETYDDDCYAQELIRYRQQSDGRWPGMVVLRLDRGGEGWTATAVGEEVDLLSWTRWVEALRRPTDTPALSVGDVLRLGLA